MWARSYPSLGLSRRLTILFLKPMTPACAMFFSKQLETRICQCLAPKRWGLLLTQEDPGSIGRFLLERRRGEQCPHYHCLWHFRCQPSHGIVNLNSKVPLHLAKQSPHFKQGEPQEAGSATFRFTVTLLTFQDGSAVGFHPAVNIRVKMVIPGRPLMW